MREDFTEDQEFQDEDFDTFLEMIGYRLEAPGTRILNPRRVKELEMAYGAISKIVLSISPDAKIDCKIHEADMTQAVIRIETDELVVENIKAFISGIENASNFEIYPLNKGKIRMAIIFHDIMKELSDTIE